MKFKILYNEERKTYKVQVKTFLFWRTLTKHDHLGLPVGTEINSEEEAKRVINEYVKQNKKGKWKEVKDG